MLHGLKRKWDKIKKSIIIHQFIMNNKDLINKLKIYEDEIIKLVVILFHIRSIN